MRVYVYSSCIFLAWAGAWSFARTPAIQQPPAQGVPSVRESTQLQEPAHHELYETGKIHFSAPPPRAMQSGAQCDLDGNLYLARATNPALLYAVSSDGTIVRELSVKLPHPGLKPVEISFAGGNSLVMQLAHTPTRQDPHSRSALALLDLGASEITDTYHLPPPAVGRALFGCVTSREEFLFLGTSVEGHLEITKFIGR